MNYMSAPRADLVTPGVQVVVSKRELNQQTAEVLDRVGAQQPVVVTERGVPRWLISEYRQELSWFEDMDRQGLVIHPSDDPAPFDDIDLGPERSDEEVLALLDEVRGERF